MGPIEKELRNYRFDVPNFWCQAGCVFSWPAFYVVQDAGRSLGLRSGGTREIEERIHEVISEAIEAAEALGL